MPNYYIGTAKVGIGCEEENGKLTYIDLPNTYGFKDRELAGKLKIGDRLLFYVAPNWGFVMDIEVQEGYVGPITDKLKDFPFRVNVKVLCEIRDKQMMPKWSDLWHHLHKCQGKSPKGAAQILRKPIIPIDEHDYKLIAAAIRQGKGKTKQGLSPTDFVEGIRELLQRYDQKT